MKKIEALIRPNMAGKVLDALRALKKTPGCTISLVEGYGKSFAEGAGERELEASPKVKLELVVDDGAVKEVVDAIMAAARTNAKGDGKIFILDCADAVRIRTGENGRAAL